MDFSIKLYGQKVVGIEAEEQLNANTLDEIAADCLVVGIFSNYQEMSFVEKEKFGLTGALEVLIDSLFSEGDFKGSIRENFIVFHPKGLKATRLMLLGLGSSKKFDKNAYFEALSVLAGTIKTMHIKKLVCTLAGVAINMGLDARVVLHITVITYKISQYQFSKFKTSFSINNSTKKEFSNKKNNLPFGSSTEWLTENFKLTESGDPYLNEVTFISKGISQISVLKKYDIFLKEAISISNGIELTRNLANAPSNVCTPAFLAKVAKNILGAASNMTVDVLDFEEIKNQGLRAFLSVAKGSVQSPYLIVMKYHGVDDALTQPIVFIGKGITFDSGGISIKPAEKMDEMRYDMSGAAAVLGVMHAASEMRLPLNLVGIIPACENMPGSNALKPGDIVESLSGKTIEVLNTDAEGRLILCDALTYAERFAPQEVIDIATLTGACVVALGHCYSGLFSNSENLASDLLAVSQEIDDTCWRLPIDSSYKKQLKSNFADIANIGGRAAGSVTAACFLSYFSEKFSWAHLDIAGTAWSPDKKGATGRPVHLLLYYLLKRLDSMNSSRNQIKSNVNK